MRCGADRALAFGNPLREFANHETLGDISKMQIHRFHADESDAKDVASILAESVGAPTEAAIGELMQSCTSNSLTTLWVARCEDAPVGIVRLDSSDRSRCIITHIAVHPEWRGVGIGRRLIAFVRDDLRFGQLEAETDDDAVGFYRSCGFEIEPLGEKYPGVQRYKCVVRFQ